MPKRNVNLNFHPSILEYYAANIDGSHAESGKGNIHQVFPLRHNYTTIYPLPLNKFQRFAEKLMTK